MEQNEKLEAGLSRLQEEQQKNLNACLHRIAQWKQFEKDYESLHSFLGTVPDKLTHNVMVPFGKLAFAPGKLINTNEVLVLLGDNWFAERSSKQAQGIVERRLQSCKETLTKLEQEKEQSEGWIKHTEYALGEGMKEIIEEYDPARDISWKEKRMQGKQTEENKQSVENKDSQRRISRVHWQDEDGKPTAVISFRHSDTTPPETLQFQEGEMAPTVTSPGDIWPIFGSPTAEQKSILKSAKPVANNMSSSIVHETKDLSTENLDDENHVAKDDTNQAFTGTIVETDINATPKVDTEVQKRPVSKFKAQRSKK